MSSAPDHVPVMLARVLELLAPAVGGDGAVVVDATVGLGGHAAALLGAHPQLSLVGLDRDPQALERAGQRLCGHGDRVVLVHAGYDQLADVLARRDIRRVDGVLFDLGVSSLQLDATARGFAYAHDAPLDMRMDPTDSRTAEDVVNTYSVAELAGVLRRFGEERFARRIAEAIVAERQHRPLTSSAQLAELVRAAVPAPARRRGGHPAKRTFQALRIEVNDELATLARALPQALAALRVGGRIVVLAYQSLEDRIVKRQLVAGARPPGLPGFPVETAADAPVLRLLTRGAETPSAAEVASNPRAASARLRAAERLREAA